MDWKENKMVGIVAGVVALIMVALVVNQCRKFLLPRPAPAGHVTPPAELVGATQRGTR